MNPGHLLAALATLSLSGCYYVGPYSYYPTVPASALNRETPLNQAPATARGDNDRPYDSAHPYETSPSPTPMNGPGSSAHSPATSAGAARTYLPPSQQQPPPDDASDQPYPGGPEYGGPGYPPPYPAYPAYQAYAPYPAYYPGYYPGYAVAPAISFGFGYRGHR